MMNKFSIKVVLYAWLIAFSTALAQTEIEGAISGEWNLDGNPYIVVDSSWVAEGEELILLGGVEVQFNADQGLYVFGDIIVRGTPHDSVYFRVSDGVEHWRSINIYSQDTTKWNYASIICPENAIQLDTSSMIVMEHSLIDAGMYSFWNVQSERYGVLHCHFLIEHSIIRARGDFRMYEGRLTANHTTFDFIPDEDDLPGFYGGRHTMTSCDVIGRLDLSFRSIIDSCRFLSPLIDIQSYVRITGRDGKLTNSYVNGSVRIIGEGTPTPCINNIIRGRLTVQGIWSEIKNCEIDGKLNIDDAIGVILHNSIFNNDVLIQDTRIVIADSCFFPNGVLDDYSYEDRGYDGHQFFDEVCIRNFTRNVFKRKLEMEDGEMDGNILFDHNTFYLGSDESDLIDCQQDVTFTNNIFMSTVPVHSLFQNNNIPIFENNCVFGFTYAAGRRDDTIDLMEFSNSNLLANPMIEWDGLIPNLPADSPCIDHGDPEFERDPDGTRTDIGARYFDQGLHVPRLETISSNNFQLTDIYPNPFNGMATLVFSLTQPAAVEIDIFNALGRRQVGLVSGMYQVGLHNVSWNGSGLPSGDYFARMTAGGLVSTQKVTMIK